jgi:hypothetical protein
MRMSMISSWETTVSRSERADEDAHQSGIPIRSRAIQSLARRHCPADSWGSSIVGRDILLRVAIPEEDDVQIGSDEQRHPVRIPSERLMTQGDISSVHDCDCAQDGTEQVGMIGDFVGMDGGIVRDSCTHWRISCGQKREIEQRNTLCSRDESIRNGREDLSSEKVPGEDESLSMT